MSTISNCEVVDPKIRGDSAEFVGNWVTEIFRMWKDHDAYITYIVNFFIEDVAEFVQTGFHQKSCIGPGKYIRIFLHRMKSKILLH